MNEEIRIKMAEREGWVRINKKFYARKSKIIIGLPTYDNDNDLDRYIRGMSDWEKEKYSDELVRIVLGYNPQEFDPDQLADVLSATEAQKQEAIIKAEGRE